MPLFSPDFVSIDGYPEIEPSLKLDFANSRALDSRITFTRASIATYVNSNGLIETAGEDEARFDHDPTTGESLGLLIEESRTNLIAQSYGIGAGWGNNGNTLSVDFAAISPYGVAVATKMTEQNTNNYHASYYQTVPVDGSSQYTLSAWLKKATTYNTSANGTGNFQLYCSRGTGGVASVTIDPTFTTITDNNADDSSITQYPDGWIRVSLTFTSNAAASVTPHFLFGGGGLYQGDGTNAVYIWGVQFELGSFVTSFIPTEGATATRVLDYMTLNEDNFSSWNNQYQGTYLMSIKNNSTDVSGLPSPARTTSIFLFLGPGGHYTKNTTSNVQVSQLSVNTTDFRKWAFYHDGANGYGMCVDGSTPINATQAIGTSDTAIVFNDIQGQTSFYLKSLFYYPKRLTNTQLQTLTQ